MESVPAASAGTEQQFVTWEVVGNVFEVPSYYTDVQAIGIGGFGLVWYAQSARWAAAPLRVGPHAAGGGRPARPPWGRAARHETR